MILAWASLFNEMFSGMSPGHVGEVRLHLCM